MDQPPIEETPPPVPEPPAMSLAARLLNVFAVPGDVFLQVKATPHTLANWLVPALIASVVGALSGVVILSQPAIQQEIHEQQEQMIEKQVEAGKMSRADADRAEAVMAKMSNPTMLKIFGAFGATASGFARLFWWGLVLWLLGRWLLKAHFGYLKAVEVAGLASMISVLGMIVTMLLVVNFGNLTSTPSLALAVSDFDMKNKGHLLLGAMNVFSFWLVGVMASGLARLAGVPFVRAAFLVLAYWMLAELFQIFTGLRALGV